MVSLPTIQVSPSCWIVQSHHTKSQQVTSPTFLLSASSTTTYRSETSNLSVRSTGKVLDGRGFLPGDPTTNDEISQTPFDKETYSDLQASQHGIACRIVDAVTLRRRDVSVQPLKGGSSLSRKGARNCVACVTDIRPLHCLF